ncbi:XRE family transcriptional regulator [Pedobacter sp. MC2016-05]|uniref:XRE family transcriptional regulator n=1 Tax=Pedobacter sp. MC2016-05 TaxID=2994474 RepID=UPI002246F717|nr:XRE family transcriptional regulator [Pedobacter sp. MC2016-05]MCX2476925.1 XRE family transcriptional regulator [Pedobacter sp. MC2016-05]
MDKKVISEIDYLLIKEVKALRIKKGISKAQLSSKLKLASSFIGKVEDLSQRDKYSIRHLPLLVKALDLKSIGQLFPKIPVNNIIEITYEKVAKLNKDGSESKQFEEKIIQIIPISKNYE